MIKDYEITNYRLTKSGVLASVKMKLISLFLLFCLVITSGCNFRLDGKSDADRERECEEECAKMTSMPSLNFNFMYYDSALVDSVIVKEISIDKKDTVTHLVKAKYRIDHCCTPRKTTWVPFWALEKEIPLQNEYLIIITGEAPHRIRNFKMGPKPLCNMFDCDFTPVLKQFELDGKVDDDNDDRITFWKK